MRWAAAAAMAAIFGALLLACPQRPAKHLLGDNCGREGESCCDEGPCYPGLGCANGTCQFLASAQPPPGPAPVPAPTKPAPTGTGTVSPPPPPPMDAGSCPSTDMGEGSKAVNRCGVPTNEIQCGTGWACTGICGVGPTCFSRQSCCADSCLAWDGPRNVVCPGDTGTLSTGETVPCEQPPALVGRSVGCQSKGGQACGDGNHCIAQGAACCSNGLPSFGCGIGATCAQSKRGGICCTKKKGAGSYCKSDLECASSLCADGICRRKPCKSSGQACAMTGDCCGTYVCGKAMTCVQPQPSQFPSQLQ